MVSRLLSITALFVFFLSTNSFAGCGSSDLSVLQNQSLYSWSSKNLTITITEKGSRCSPNYKVKVKDLETLLEIKYKALSPGTFVIDLTKADKDNQIIGELKSFTLSESDAHKILIKKIDNVEDFNWTVFTGVNVETEELVVFLSGKDYTTTDSSYSEEYNEIKIGDLALISPLSKSEVNQVSSFQVSKSYERVLLEREYQKEFSIDKAILENAAKTVTDGITKAIAEEAAKRAEQKAIRDAERKERDRIANICELHDESGEIKFVEKGMGLIVSKDQFLGSPSEKKSETDYYRNAFNSTSLKTIMVCLGSNNLVGLPSSFYADLVGTIVYAKKVSKELKEVVKKAEAAFLKITIPNGFLFGDESDPDLEVREVAFKQARGRILVFAEEEDLNAILDYYSSFL